MRFLKDEKGQGLSEYALIIALVAVVAIAGLVLLGPIILDKFNEVSCNMQGEGWKNPTAGETGWFYFKDQAAYTAGKGTGTAIAWNTAGCYKVTKA